MSDNEKSLKSLMSIGEGIDEEQFRVCREQGTEAPFSGKLLHNKSDGIYRCVCCDTALFSSENKYDSGCGWPSFDAPINDTAIRYLKDLSHGMVRTEIRCGACDSHLGHVLKMVPKRRVNAIVSIQFL